MMMKASSTAGDGDVDRHDHHRARPSGDGSSAPSAPGLFSSLDAADGWGQASPPGRPRVVIVGAGFGGLQAAQALRDAPVEVCLIDRNNYHTFQPLLYQVATAGLEPGEIAHSVRGIFQHHENFSFRLGTATGVDFDARQVLLAEDAPVSYNYLILAPGTSTQYFDVEGAREHALPMKGLAGAVNLRSHVLRRFEEAASDPRRVKAGELTFAVVGGGPTGVETAGALVELFDLVLKRDFHGLDLSKARVYLIEMTPHLLSPYDEQLRAYALNALRERGVEVLLGETVERVTADAVHLESGRRLPTKTLIWAAGVRAASLVDALEVEQAGGGRVVVREDLSLPGRPDVFVVGDTAAATGEDGRPYPQLAPVAVQEGGHAARQIVRRLRGRDTEPFRYRDPGMMATIGRKAAVVELPGGLRFTGFGAWLLWIALHIWKLIGFRNRFSVMFDWIYNYFTYDRSTRLIFEARSAPERTEEDLRHGK